MENKKKIERNLKVVKELLGVFKKYGISSFDICEILDDLKFAVLSAMIKVNFKHKDK